MMIHYFQEQGAVALSIPCPLCRRAASRSSGTVFLGNVFPHLLIQEEQVASY